MNHTLRNVRFRRAFGRNLLSALSCVWVFACALSHTTCTRTSFRSRVDGAAHLQKLLLRIVLILMPIPQILWRVSCTISEKAT